MKTFNQFSIFICLIVFACMSGCRLSNDTDAHHQETADEAVYEETLETETEEQENVIRRDMDSALEENPDPLQPPALPASEAAEGGEHSGGRAPASQDHAIEEETASIPPGAPNSPSPISLPPQQQEPAEEAIQIPEIPLDALKALATERIGKIGYNTFDSIEVEETRLIQIFITKDTTQDLASPIHETLVTTDPETNITQVHIPIDLYMSTSIICPMDNPEDPAFTIELTNPPAQKSLQGNEPPHWEWKVKANKTGKHLIVIRAYTHDRRDGETFIPLIEKEVFRSSINVKALPSPGFWQQANTTLKTAYASFIDKIETDPEFLLAGLIIPLLGFLYKLFTQRKQSET